LLACKASRPDLSRMAFTVVRAQTEFPSLRITNGMGSRSRIWFADEQVLIGRKRLDALGEALDERAQLAPFADLLGSRIAVHGPKLRLKGDSAQAIGLALHELAINAGKYGALSTNMGRVDVSWGTDGDTFTMNWTERDGPPVPTPKQRGFGTIVIEAMAEYT
jgi:hypothetical protein